MDAIISDITEKVVAKNRSYKVDIFNRDSGCHIEIDGTFEEFNNQKLVDSINLALGNGKKWYKLARKDNKWIREDQDVPKND